MATKHAKESRVLKLSKVPFHPRNFAGAIITVDSQGYVGNVLALGVALIDEVSRAQGNQAKPTYLQIADHATKPDDVIAIPTMDASPDHIPIKWQDEGRWATVNLAELLTLKEIVIPDGTRMEIDLYQDVDADFGPCVGLKLKGARFEPKQKGRTQAKAGAAQA